MKPNLMKAIAGGLAGTIMMTLMMRFVAPIMLGHLSVDNTVSGC